jgi:F-type H+/Na+-transporting ATPase subunit beta
MASTIKQTTKKNIGKISQIVGVVVDIEFPVNQLPAIYNAVEVKNGDEMLVLEVAQHFKRVEYTCGCAR